MRAFLTGSRVYGVVKPESDIDLVIQCSHQTAMELISLSDSERLPLRFGKLNIIPCVTEAEYAAWKAGTEMLSGNGTKTREEAVAVFTELFQRMKVDCMKVYGNEESSVN